jgi:aspartate aminotransferase
MDIKTIPRSKIGDIGRLAFGDPSVDFLCFGESDHLPPDAAKVALIAALQAGDTHYVDSRGRGAFREAIAGYLSALHALPVSESRILVAASGMAAISIAFTALLHSGDKVVVHEPEWPNLASAALAHGAAVTRLPLEEDGAGGFRLDLNRLDTALRGARLFCLNSPNNPTGWMAQDGEIRAIMALCRKHGAWLLSDEVYSRLVFDGRQAAPSVLDHAGPEDHVITINSVSKTWAMTGFRVGWLVVPESMRDAIGELTEITHSAVAPYSQQAAQAALQDNVFPETFRNFCLTGRDIVKQGLAGLNNVHCAVPDASFYAFARIDGVTDSLDFAVRLVREHKVAVAPGSAFGASGEGHVRLCFAQSADKLDRAMARLRRGIAALT